MFTPAKQQRGWQSISQRQVDLKSKGKRAPSLFLLVGPRRLFHEAFAAFFRTERYAAKIEIAIDRRAEIGARLIPYPHPATG